MSGRIRSRFLRHIVQILAILLLPRLVAPAQAADASNWDRDAHSAVRLIGASMTNDGKAAYRAGLEISLDKGWKTYWRYPGDSGVPPRFSFDRSENLKAVEVKYPAPHRFSDGGGQSIGYKDHVIFPLAIEPQDAKRPVTLRLDMEYAVCEKLCVPAQAKLELVLSKARTEHDSVVTTAEQQVPQPRALGAKPGLSIVAVKREAPDRVAVDMVVPNGATVDLFAEGPSPAWALPLPEPVADAPAGLTRFAITLDGLPPNETADGATLTLTAVAGGTAVEVHHRLDQPKP
jgi:DsbC/DsbD-like thiol-disulfide interchange protein